MHNVEVLPFMLNLKSSEKFLSILPIWHIFERTVEYVAIRRGASNWYTSSLTILKDLAVVKPTWMARQHHDFQREGNPVGYYVHTVRMQDIY